MGQKIGHMLRDGTIKQGFGPGSRIYFQDNIPGPHLAMYRMGQSEVLFDESDYCKHGGSKADWAAAFAQRDAILRGPHAPGDFQAPANAFPSPP